MGIANIRALTYDKERAERSEATGDGTTVDFALPQRLVVDLSDSITDAGSAQTRGTDYTINNETGVVTFTTAPTNGNALVFNFRHTILSDTDLNAFLTLYEQDDFMAAAQALETMAAHEVMVQKVIRINNVQTDGARQAEALRKLAATLREQSAEGTFDYVEVNWSGLNADEILYNQILRSN